MEPEEDVARLEAELEELRRRLPPHSLRSAMLRELEELEEKLQRAREASGRAQGNGGR